MADCISRWPFSSAALQILILLLGFTPLMATAAPLIVDTFWQGEVEVSDDVYVPPGITLTVAPGTRIRVLPAESTKIDPEYLSHQTEIIVRGLLRVQGSADASVSFAAADQDVSEQWAGIIIDEGGRAEFNYCTIRDSETAVTVVDASVELRHCRLVNNRYGMVVEGAGAAAVLDQTEIRENDYGLLNFGSVAVVVRDSLIGENRKKDRHEVVSDVAPIVGRNYTSTDPELSRLYGDEALGGDTVWEGRIRVDGLVRLPVEGRLLIMPGTVVEFGMRDSNGDGIGENGLLIQGTLIAKGSAEKPIIFRSADSPGQPGSWDAINILGSDQLQNLVEFCQIEDAYRGLHLHYANVAVNHSVLRNNFRGAQFQESLATFTSCQFYGNRSAVQARDSEVAFYDNEIFANQTGANFFRIDLEARGNIFVNNGQDGLRIREGASQVEENLLAGNRFGLLVADAFYGKFTRNLVSNNLETGLALRNTDHLAIESNAIQSNAINGIVIRESRGVISGNLINANGERGIGVISFAGLITANNIVGNGRYAIGLEGSAGVNAQGNWWGTSDLDREIYDRHDESWLGEVHYDRQLPVPVDFTWPLSAIRSPVNWAGSLLIDGTVTVLQGGHLAVMPATTVTFGAGGGLEVLGSLKAVGNSEQRIVFTSRNKTGAAEWGEISFQQAAASEFSYCDIEYGSWGMHSHFTPLTINNSLFRHNDGGLRFRSGPLEITGSIFRDNRIGIRSFRGNGVIKGSEITANEIGIFVREESGGLLIEHNNIYGNERYNIRLGDFNRQDLDARRNWWGDDAPLATIFDGHQEPGVGLVHYDPVLEKPVLLPAVTGSVLPGSRE